ncbi:unnamed protein product [Colias eurytheme]|nr:unnamed protein product [Colias eurytheme]
MLQISSSLTINSVPWGRASDLSMSSTSSSKASQDTTDLNVIYFDRYSLPYFKACIFATILEDAMMQTNILQSCNTELQLNKIKGAMTQLLADKFGVVRKEVKDELDLIDPKNLCCLEYKIDKLENDRNFLYQVLKETYLDLSKHRRCHALFDHVCKINNKHEYRENLIEIEAKNRIVRRDLNRQLRQQRNHFKSVTYDSNTVIDELKNKVGDAALNVEICDRYVKNWQNARTEQHTQRIWDKEAPCTQVIEFYKQKIDQEQRVHTEVELLISILINETLDKVEHWMAKYEKDMEAMDLKIQLKKNEWENTEERRIQLEEKLKKHGEEITNWVSFKDKREADRLYRENMTKSACMIQAWWRGLLVRLELGPYKPVKKRPTQDKKKKK